MMKKWLCFFALVVLFSSCKKYIISRSDLDWQPYREGDILIFESNKKEIDTIKIESIEIYTNPNDPIALFPEKSQTLFVSDENLEVLILQAGKNGTDVHFPIRLGKRPLNYPCTILNLQKLKRVKRINSSIVLIEAFENCDNMKDRSFDLSNILWSKEFGYLKMEFKDDYSWELKSFVRGGKEILNNDSM